MGAGIGAVLPFAVGIAISPISIIAIVLMLFTRRARVNGPLFLVGWAGGLTALSTVVYLLAGAAGAGADDESSTKVGWIKLALGVVLLGLTARRVKAGDDDEKSMPSWMNDLEHLSPTSALGLGVLLGSLNPKNLVLTLGAIVGLAQLALPGTEAAGSIVVFVVIASLSIAGAVIYYLVGGDSAETRLNTLKMWMTRHSNAVMAVLLGLIGVVLISQGLAALA